MATLPGTESAAAPLSVLLTGGPGGGKSSALATLRDRLTKRGFQVLIVPETATVLLNNSGGYDPAWHGTHRHVEIQEQILKCQMHQEDAFRHIASMRPAKPHVILHDRGVLDGRVFCTEEQWNDVIKSANTSEEALLKRYDLVMHMTSVAAGMDHLYDYGPGSTNPARYHTPEQARETDGRAQEIYAKHPQVRVVPNFAEFSQKIETVIRYVVQALHVDGVAGPRERQLIPKHADQPRWPVRREMYEAQVTFLDTKFTESIRKRRLLHAHAAGSTGSGSSAVVGAAEAAAAAAAGEVVHDVVLAEQTELYEYRREVVKGDSSYCSRQVLTAEAFQLLRDRRAERCVEVRKVSECFTWEGRYYELCSYAAADGSPLAAVKSSEGVELQHFLVLDKPAGSPSPPWLAAPPPAPATAELTPVRTLSRKLTAEAAASQEEALQRSGKKPRLSCPPKSLKRGPTARLEALLNSPKHPALSRVAALACEEGQRQLPSQQGKGKLADGEWA